MRCRWWPMSCAPHSATSPAPRCLRLATSRTSSLAMLRQPLTSRTLPGLEPQFLKVFDELIGPHVKRETIVHDPAHEGPLEGAVPDAIAMALAAEDKDGRIMPSLDTGGTDAKAFVPLGIQCYGFTPLQFPADEPHPELYHGIDERVPVDGLEFGVRVLDRIFDAI